MPIIIHRRSLSTPNPADQHKYFVAVVGFLAVALGSLIGSYAFYRLLRALRSYRERKARQRLEDIESQAARTCPTVANLSLPAAARQTKAEKIKEVQRFSDRFASIKHVVAFPCLQVVHPRVPRAAPVRPSSLSHVARYSSSKIVYDGHRFYIQPLHPRAARSYPTRPSRPSRNVSNTKCDKAVSIRSCTQVVHPQAPRTAPAMPSPLRQSFLPYASDVEDDEVDWDDPRPEAQNDHPQVVCTALTGSSPLGQNAQSCAPDVKHDDGIVTRPRSRTGVVHPEVAFTVSSGPISPDQDVQHGASDLKDDEIIQDGPFTEAYVVHLQAACDAPAGPLPLGQTLQSVKHGKGILTRPRSHTRAVHPQVVLVAPAGPLPPVQSVQTCATDLEDDEGVPNGPVRCEGLQPCEPDVNHDKGILTRPRSRTGAVRPQVVLAAARPSPLVQNVQLAPDREDDEEVPNVLVPCEGAYYAPVGPSPHGQTLQACEPDVKRDQGILTRPRSRTGAVRPKVLTAAAARPSPLVQNVQLAPGLEDDEEVPNGLVPCEGAYDAPVRPSPLGQTLQPYEPDVKRDEGILTRPRSRTGAVRPQVVLVAARPSPLVQNVQLCVPDLEDDEEVLDHSCTEAQSRQNVPPFEPDGKHGGVGLDDLCPEVQTDHPQAACTGSAKMSSLSQNVQPGVPDVKQDAVVPNRPRSFTQVVPPQVTVAASVVPPPLGENVEPCAPDVKYDKVILHRPSSCTQDTQPEVVLTPPPRPLPLLPCTPDFKDEVVPGPGSDAQLLHPRTARIVRPRSSSRKENVKPGASDIKRDTLKMPSTDNSGVSKVNRPRSHTRAVQPPAGLLPLDQNVQPCERDGKHDNVQPGAPDSKHDQGVPNRRPRSGTRTVNPQVVVAAHAKSLPTGQIVQPCAPDEKQQEVIPNCSRSGTWVVHPQSIVTVTVKPPSLGQDSEPRPPDFKDNKAILDQPCPERVARPQAIGTALSHLGQSVQPYAPDGKFDDIIPSRSRSSTQVDHPRVALSLAARPSPLGHNVQYCASDVKEFEAAVLDGPYSDAEVAYSGIAGTALVRPACHDLNEQSRAPEINDGKRVLNGPFSETHVVDPQTIRPARNGQSSLDQNIQSGALDVKQDDLILNRPRSGTEIVRPAVALTAPASQSPLSQNVPSCLPNAQCDEEISSPPGSGTQHVHPQVARAASARPSSSPNGKVGDVITSHPRSYVEITYPEAARTIPARPSPLSRNVQSDPPHVKHEEVVPSRPYSHIQPVHPKAARTYPEGPPPPGHIVQPRSSRMGSNNLLFYRSSVPPRAPGSPPPHPPPPYPPPPTPTRQTVDYFKAADSVVGAHPDAVSPRGRLAPMIKPTWADFPWVPEGMVFGLVHTIDTRPPPSPEKPKKVMKNVKNTGGYKWGTVSYTLGVVKDGKRTAGGKENTPIPAAMLV